MIRDMTEGSPSKLLWAFSLPMLFSVMFQQLYNIADSVIAGQFVGENALAAVGASYPITMIFMAVATGSNIGCSVVISQLFGAKNYGKMKCCIYTSIISIISLSLIFTVLGTVFTNPLMNLLKTPGEIFSDSALYLRVYVFGLLFLFVYNICTGIFTALGDSRTPLYFLIASSLSNIVMDVVFVVFFKMGVAGVAWATFICQGAAACLAFAVLIKRIKGIETEKNEKIEVFSLSMLGRISIMAVPSIMQQSFISIGNLFIQGLINLNGPAVIAGYSAAVKLNTFVMTCFNTLANGVSSFTAQNVGAGKSERVKKGYRAGLIMEFCIAVPFVAAFLIFGSQMLGIFMSYSESSPEAFDAGRSFLNIVAPFYLVVTVKIVTDGLLRGAGSVLAFTVSTFTDLALRVILSFVLTYIFAAGNISPSYWGIWISWPVGWIISTIISLIFYFRGTWKKRAFVNI